MAAYSSPFEFGSGDVWAIPVGSLLPNITPTPVRFGTLQDISIDMAQATKDLYGKLRLPAAIAGTTLKITGKAKAAEFNAQLYNQVFLNGASAAGQTLVPLNSSNLPGETMPSAGTTYTVANPTGFIDLGVYSTVTGLYLTKIAAGSPAAWQYKVTGGGAYTFGTSAIYIVFYTYTNSAVGNTLTLPNYAMGANPNFSLSVYNNQWQQHNMFMQLNNCGANKLTFGWKNEDWMVPEFDFYAMDDGTGNWGVLSVDALGT